MSIVNQMSIFVEPGSYQSEIIRAVVALKGAECRVVEVGTPSVQAQIASLTHYSELPLLVDREVTLNGLDMILEFLDDRYPAPSLLPHTPVSRANARMTLRRIETEMFVSLARAADGDQPAKRVLEDTLEALGNLFFKASFLCSESMSIADVAFTVFLKRCAEQSVNTQRNPLLTKYFNAMYQQPMFAKLRGTAKAA